MPSERIQRRIDRLLEEADAALDTRDWAAVRERAELKGLDGEYVTYAVGWA